MASIACTFNLNDQPASTADLQLMLDVQAHRGPDGGAAWTGGPVGLACGALFTTPESVLERLPLTHAASGTTIAADARIDNRDELIRALALPRAEAAAMGDGALILAAYRRWGTAAPSKLVGDFAFAIWDSRQQRLFAARDALGVKPLHYHHAPQRLFALASEEGALRALPAVPLRLDEGRIADFLVSELEGIDKTSTFSANIQRLPPACWMTVDRKGLRTRTWWAPEVTQPIRFRSDDQYVDAFLEHFSRAVRCRLRSVTPPASMLSGGMDSSAVVAVARSIQNQSGGTRLHTFSAVTPDGSSCPETHFIHRVLGSGSQAAHLVAADRLDPFLGDLQQAAAAPDNLFDIFMTLPLALYRAARGEGCTTLLDGVAGDSLCSVGTGYLAHLLRQGRWLTVLADAFRKGTTVREYDSAWYLLHTNARAALATDRLRKLKQRFLPGDDGVREAMRESAIRPAFAARIGLKDRLRQLRSHHAGGLSQNPVQAHARKLRHPYLTVGLERYDRVAARCGIEPRCPYTDRRLVEFYLSLPLDQKDRRGWSKYLLRRSMTRHLPRDVCFRTDKHHLGWQFTTALMESRKAHLNRTITRELSEVGDYVDETKVRQANRRLQGGTASDLDRQFVWEAAALVAWKKTNLECRLRYFGQKEIII